MKIAVTADCHLTSREQNPERFETLERLLADLREQDVKTLIIAGDLFDASRQNYADFERLCRQGGNEEISILIIPGNHDLLLDNRAIAADNVRVITAPEIWEGPGMPFLFLPYQAGKGMGEVIAEFGDRLPPGGWVLVGHGNWTGGLRAQNPNEPGVYMPLSGKDIELYRPARALLGHIHLPTDARPVHYPGSPCGLDINETGRRRYLVYDSETDQVEEHPIDTPVLYFNESIVIVPARDEAAYLRRQIEAILERWDLQPEEKSKAQIRIKVAGYSMDKVALRSLLNEAFSEFTFYKGQEPDIDQVFISDDREREHIAEAVRASLEAVRLPRDKDAPDPDEILLQALHIIYAE